ncbi:hypothetical protein DFQ28_006666 [Apophysomyces sp. BC1034]|nr:hypothetical protein DFQ30_004664 [Apophysomyces sp. BC1015]KAG0182563.1 hypothetical protein DFQ29_003565 [Apophysomyces sp. BC1021]KAG0193072.1 hypothetical protein DFQ28_006666 [Apophysomyces sp. BC1034]
MTDTAFKEKGDAFWSWLEQNGATLSDGIEFKDYSNENAGRGVVATKDFKEGDILFSIPRKLLLSEYTSKLRKLDAMDENLDSMAGWNPLILSMMYENRADSFWKPYLDILPRTFSTPIFWNKEDLKELEGTDVPAKIGKPEAEDMFKEEIASVIKGHPELFDENIHTLDLFHICGSLVMAYSFHDERGVKDKGYELDSDDEELEEELGKDLIAMVPMADMLNHKTGFNNARLFHEADRLEMKAIISIAKGDQIYNTYGELCNADLLRKYGFIDENNPFDICELDEDLVMSICANKDDDDQLREKKIDFLMGEGILEDCFVLDNDYQIPPELIITAHVLKSSKDEINIMIEKDKLPKPNLTPEIKDLILKVLEKRLARYPTSLEDDLVALEADDLRLNKRNALQVRIGEKQVLLETLKNLKNMTPRTASKRSAEKDERPAKHRK